MQKPSALPRPLVLHCPGSVLPIVYPLLWLAVCCLVSQIENCRSRKQGERSSKRKRHHAEHAEPAASQHVPVRATPVTDARVKLEAADEVVSPSKRIKKERAEAPVKARTLLRAFLQTDCVHLPAFIRP